MSAQLDPEFSSHPQNELPQYYRSILRSFRKTIQSYVVFHIVFAALVFFQVALFLFFLPFLSHSPFIALSLGGLFLTCFSYCVLLFYFQAKKPEQFFQLKEQFAKSCKQLFSDPLSLAESFSKLCHYLNGFEKKIYESPKPFTRIFQRAIGRFSAACYGEDVTKMQTLLLQAAIDEHIKQIRLKPTDLEAHASLASTYFALAKLTKNNQPLFDRITRLAIEELKIVCHYAPNDPWAHEQLAAGYRSMNCNTEERQEIETLLKLRPNDKETLFRLGTLYFEQAENAKGLQIYEQLKASNFKKADDLIEFYQGFSQKNS